MRKIHYVLEYNGDDVKNPTNFTTACGVERNVISDLKRTKDINKVNCKICKKNVPNIKDNYL